MLDWEGQGLDLQEIWLTEQAIDIDAKGMCSELGIEPGAEAPKGMCMVGFDLELFGELAVNGFNDLAHGIVQALLFSR